ncbi:asparagine synthase (glutamine-hydrolyzing) [Candidatus Omnitrophota bacterium]
MCGICGIIDYREKQVKEETIRRMCSKMQHRGPDDEGVYVSNQSWPVVGLGHRRLKVIDLSSAGRQPISNEDDSLYLVINGEIYNYLDLRKGLEEKGHRFKSQTDSEVVLHLYEDHAEDCLQYLRGAFAFAIWDKKGEKLFFARDRLGQKPLLFSWQKGRFSFASEFCALLASGLIEKKINHAMIDSYLRFGYIPAPQSIYENVHKLLPGHFAILHKEKLVLNSYWSLDYKGKINIDEKEATDELERIATEAVRIRLQSDVPLGVFLSGGLDSSMIVAIMARLGAKIKTFSIGFKEKAYSELKYASMVAKRYSTDHREFMVTPKAREVVPLLVQRYGEPYADSSAIPSYYVARETRRFVTVALNGDGGDEAFAGYERYQAMYLAEAYSRLPGFLRDKILPTFTRMIPDSIHFHNPLRRARRFLKGAQLPRLDRYTGWMSFTPKQILSRIYTKSFKKRFSSGAGSGYLSPFLDNFGRLELLDTLLLTDISTNLPNDLTVKMDIATMANSLEARSPFLDQEVMGFMASMPARLKFKGLNKKYLIKQLAKEYLPKEIIQRKKRGFGVPVGDWFRGELKGFLFENLLSRKSMNRGYFMPEVIKMMIKEHAEAREDYANPLWTLLMLELWHQKFID